MKERREKEEEREQVGTSAPGAQRQRRGEVLASGKAPSQAGRSVGTERELQELLEESAVTGLWQAGQSETYTDGSFQ